MTPFMRKRPSPCTTLLVGEPSADEITTELQLTGRRLAYTLAIPKGDVHSWADAKVEFSVGLPHLRRRCAGHREHDPARWNKKVQVVQFE